MAGRGEVVHLVRAMEMVGRGMSALLVNLKIRGLEFEFERGACVGEGAGRLTGEDDA